MSRDACALASSAAEAAAMQRNASILNDRQYKQKSRERTVICIADNQCAERFDAGNARCFVYRWYLFEYNSTLVIYWFALITDSFCKWIIATLIKFIYINDSDYCDITPCVNSFHACVMRNVIMLSPCNNRKTEPICTKSQGYVA